MTDTLSVCIDCQMAKILEPGKPTIAIDSSHAQCMGTREDPCSCGCAYALGKACKRCGRSGRQLDPAGLNQHGTCIKDVECYEFVMERQRKRAAERAARMTANPTKRRSGSSGGFPAQRSGNDETVSKPTTTRFVADPAKTCLCGCGEGTKSWFRPGHDMRFISALVAAVKSGEMTEAEAVEKVSHSAALTLKLEKRLG